MNSWAVVSGLPFCAKAAVETNRTQTKAIAAFLNHGNSPVNERWIHRQSTCRHENVLLKNECCHFGSIDCLR